MSKLKEEEYQKFLAEFQEKYGFVPVSVERYAHDLTMTWGAIRELDEKFRRYMEV